MIQNKTTAPARTRLTQLALLTLALPIVGCGRPTDAAGSGRAMIQNKGSDTLVNVAQAWAEEYKNINPDLVVAVSGGGSGTGISALLNGTVDLANSSRKMKAKELEAARANGVEPKEYIVGFDALAVYVHLSNPMDSITIGQLADIYGDGGPSNTWADLKVEMDNCSGGEIARVSRQNNSGTYVYFKDTVLGKDGDYKLGSLDLHGSKDVVDLVAKTPCAMGYSGLAYANHEVKMLAIAQDANSPSVMPSTATAIDKTYPIARPLFMYTNGEPTGAVKEYLDWILSDEGQRIILAKGYAPVRQISAD